MWMNHNGKNCDFIVMMLRIGITTPKKTYTYGLTYHSLLCWSLLAIITEEHMISIYYSFYSYLLDHIYTTYLLYINILYLLYQYISFWSVLDLIVFFFKFLVPKASHVPSASICEVWCLGGQHCQLLPFAGAGSTPQCHGKRNDSWVWIGI